VKDVVVFAVWTFDVFSFILGKQRKVASRCCEAMFIFVEVDGHPLFLELRVKPESFEL